jgi:1,4-dihydroxy-2-naphthoyl-CoA hydrolase
VSTVPGVDEKQTAFMREAMPFAGLLGVEVLSASAEEVRARVAWDASRCTSGGALHGGVLMGLADACGGMSAFLNLPEGASGTTTIESKTNFLRAVRQGYVTAVTRPLHAGRTTIVIDTDLFDDEGKRVARVTQTQAVLRG